MNASPKRILVGALAAGTLLAAGLGVVYAGSDGAGGPEAAGLGAAVDSATAAADAQLCVEPGPACAAVDAVVSTLRLAVDGEPMSDVALTRAMRNVASLNDRLGVEEEDVVGAGLAAIAYQRLLAVEAGRAGVSVSTEEARAEAEAAYLDLKDDEQFLERTGVDPDRLRDEVLAPASVEARRLSLTSKRFEATVVLAGVTASDGPAARTKAKQAWMAAALGRHDVVVTGWEGKVSAFPDLLAAHEAALNDPPARSPEPAPADAGG